jgi:hypothetical protein
MGYFYAASVANDAFEFGAFIFSAGAFPVSLRPEDTLAE